jgi:hypothetical protein
LIPLLFGCGTVDGALAWSKTFCCEFSNNETVKASLNIEVPLMDRMTITWRASKRISGCLTILGESNMEPATKTTESMRTRAFLF